MGDLTLAFRKQAVRGYKEVVAEVRLGVLMPANTLPAVVARASGVINEALKLPELKETYAKFGMDTL